MNLEIACKIAVLYFINGGILQVVCDVSIHGKLVIYNGINFVNTTCTSDSPSSSAEFIVNGMSADDVRFDKGRCYHKRRLCKPTTCSCSANSFTLLQRLPVVNSVQKTTCMMRMISQQGITEFKTTPYLLFNGTEFYHVQNIPEEVFGEGVNPLNGANEGKFEKTSVAVEVGVLIFVGLLLFLSSICIIRRCLKKHKTRKGSFAKELQPLMGNKDVEILATCRACTLASVCAICSDCEIMFCVICCSTHKRSKPEHKVCQIDHVGTGDYDVKCKQCKKYIAVCVCINCVKVMCDSCGKTHSIIDTTHIIRSLVLSKGHEYERKATVALNLPELKYEYTIATRDKSGDSTSHLPRICGVCIIEDGGIILAEHHNKQIRIYRRHDNYFKYDLKQEPKWMIHIDNNQVAITYPYERQIKLYEIDGSTVIEIDTLELADKPFSIAYNKNHFAVELGDDDEGVIVILNRLGKTLHTINNSEGFAYLTSNTVSLALDMDNRKVFVAAMIKKAVSCVDFDGNVMWRKAIPSPTDIIFVDNIISHKNMLIASKRWNLIFAMHSDDGKNDIIMSSGRVEGPRYIDYNMANKLFCIHVDNGDILVYKFDITKLE